MIQIQNVRQTLLEILADNVIGIYLYGSAADAGLQPDSDIDFLVITGKELSQAERRELCRQLRDISGVPGNPYGKHPLEVTITICKDLQPWRYPPIRDFQYGEWLQDQFENDVLPQQSADSDLAILLATARQNHRVLYGPPFADLLNDIPTKDIHKAIGDSLQDLVADVHNDVRNTILTLARMWQTLSTGEIMPKNIAADWAIPKLPENLRPVLQLATAAYLGKLVDSWQGREPEIDDYVNYVVDVITQLLHQNG